MTIEKFRNEEMYVLCTPDEFPVPSTLAPDFPTCVAFIELLALVKIGQSFNELSKQGFMIMPVKVTITQNGDENKPFKKENQS